jgi:hypothetical protein
MPRARRRPRRPSLRPDVPAVPGIDLEFRPASYVADAGPVGAIVQNIAGEERRALVRDLLTGELQAGDGEVPDVLLQEHLSTPDRVMFGHAHPRCMGGEYLPAYDGIEVEIARVVLQSSTQDVFSLRARRTRTRWVYRLLDEYDSTFTLTPATSRRPLTLRRLVHMLEGAQSDELETGGDGLVLCWAQQQLDYGDSPEDAIDFVSVSSEVYPTLGRYFDARLQAWADERNAEAAECDASSEAA